MSNKKAMEQVWWIILTAVIGLIVVILVLLWFRGAGGKGFDFIGGKIGELDDCDKDKVSDLFDKCVCDQGENDGCPAVAEEQLKTMKARKKAECSPPC